MVSLLQFFPPPAHPQETGTPKTWEKLEARLGIALPSDYKALIDAFGTGTFADFITVFNPFAQNESLNLLYALDTLHQANQKTRIISDPIWSALRPFELYPAPQGLLPWGCTANLGEYFFWQIQGPPQSWETIFYLLRSGEYEVWKYPMTEFLYRLFTRSLASVFLPDDFPPSQGMITFTPA
jgi:hypothetical protein